MTPNRCAITGLIFLSSSNAWFRFIRLCLLSS
jgi:hypothetical protein